MPSTARGQGIAALLIVVSAWGLTWPVNKVILLSLSPLWAVTLRSAIATVALFALTAWRGRVTLPPAGDLPVLISITLLHMVGFNLLASWGLGLVPTGRWPTPRRSGSRPARPSSCASGSPRAGWSGCSSASPAS